MQSSDLDIFESIGLLQMDTVSLMKRVDTKFVVNQITLPSILESLYTNYQILEINGNRMMTYDSTYFDTKDTQLYLEHHNKRANRAKVRVRTYVESNLSYLEVKLKDNTGITSKKRIQLAHPIALLDAEKLDFIEQCTAHKWELSHALTNRFNRFTLVNILQKERVTFDLNLTYNGTIYHSNLAIIELKQEKLNRASPLYNVLKNAAIQPYAISKYCTGMALLYPELKQNYFKHKLLTLDKITT